LDGKFGEEDWYRVVRLGRSIVLSCLVLSCLGGVLRLDWWGRSIDGVVVGDGVLS